MIFQKDKVNGLLVKLLKKKRKRTQVNKIKNERDNITTGTTETQLHTNKLANLEKMDKLLETHNLL